MATYTPKNILITGAAGFIASHVANRLIRNYPDYKIVVLDKLDYCSNLKNLLPSKSSPSIKFVKGDIGSADLVNYLLITESIDTIMHFAAQTHVDNSFGNSFEFTKNNIYGTHVLLEACKVTGQIRRFIHVSTDEVYGETDEDAVVGNHEASQLLPTNPYSATKAGAEMLVMAYGRSYGLPVITTRGNNVYGPNQFPEKLIPKFILLAMQGKPLPIHGDGSNVRSYLYCEDVAEAFEVILHKGEVGHVYNIGTKKERRVIDVAKDICRLFSMDPEASIKFVENRPFNDQRYFLDDEKLKILGWSERTTWEEGLKKTMEWYINNPDWWGDVSGALLPHPRMLMMPGGIERHFDGPEEEKSASFVPSNTRMLVPPSKSTGSPRKHSLKFLIYGRTGWLGGLLGKICEKQGIPFEYGRGRLEDRSSLLADLQSVKPTHVFNAAGVTGRPNVDWCESHKTETIRANVAGTLTLADVCREHGLLMMNFATGCIFEYDAAHPEGSARAHPLHNAQSLAMANYNLNTDSPISRRIVRAFFDFLNSVEPAPGVDLEGLEVARECLTEAFKLNSSSVDDHIKPNLLVDLFHSLETNEHHEARTDNAHGTILEDARTDTADAKLSEASNSVGEVGMRKPLVSGMSKDELFGQFFAALEKIHFFRTMPDGNDDPVQLEKTTRLFQDASSELERSGCQTLDIDNLAETLKSQGNRAMQSKLYSDAIELYTCAIALRENNAVYYCNRAAAYTQIHQYTEAIRDCMKSIEINPSYSKAYSRLGLAYYAQGNYSDAINKGFKKAMQLDPDNDSVKENIRVAEQKLREGQQRTEHDQNTSSTSRGDQEFENQSTGGQSSRATPPQFTSMPFGNTVFPADFASMFMNMANAYQGQNSRDGHEEDNHVNGADDPEVRIGGNINLNFGEQIPEELTGALRSVMEMFTGAASHHNSQDTTNGRPPQN